MYNNICITKKEHTDKICRGCVSVVDFKQVNAIFDTFIEILIEMTFFD